MAVLSSHPILVVDDEPENLALIERILRRKFGPLHFAKDGEEGVRLLERERIDLILSDHRMPKMTGTELLCRARDLQPNAFRILVTGYGDQETLTSAINDSHAWQVVSKPIDHKLLGHVVERALELQEAAVRERELFESFVYASVTAIEQRDPSTAGHSFRVAAMTTGLAMVVDGVSEGKFASVRYSKDEVEQIKVASLLHDFGKIGVRETILTKSHKLPDWRLAVLEERLRGAIAQGTIGTSDATRVHALLRILNQPEVSASAHAQELAVLEATGLLDEEDVGFLRIERGSLSESERREIEGHVQGTIAFMKQIPWPERLARVTEIAGAHHETLTGKGYPNGTKVVPLESQMMTVCDIYDALVAADRPYKTAVPHERACEILTGLAVNKAIDPDLLELFLARKVYRALQKARLPTGPSRCTPPRG